MISSYHILEQRAAAHHHDLMEAAEHAQLVAQARRRHRGRLGRAEELSAKSWLGRRLHGGEVEVALRRAEREPDRIGATGAGHAA